MSEGEGHTPSTSLISICKTSNRFSAFGCGTKFANKTVVT
uniref:Uncharacterized protein n=1 Tax=Arundo donax TaxID=35708 RepID=A0A0A9FWJ5_ARUDO